MLLGLLDGAIILSNSDRDKDEIVLTGNLKQFKVFSFQEWQIFSLSIAWIILIGFGLLNFKLSASFCLELVTKLIYYILIDFLFENYNKLRCLLI